MTASGYPRIVKLWHRGEPIENAKTVYEGKPEDVSVQTQVLGGAGHDDVPLLIRAVDFFDAEYSYIRPDGTVQKLPLPVTVNVEGGMTGDQLIPHAAQGLGGRRQDVQAGRAGVRSH